MKTNTKDEGYEGVDWIDEAQKRCQERVTR
jgi:hypothetical protein